MENTIQSDLIRGHINTIILKALEGGDRYGYDIVKEIEQKSSGQYKLKQPTLYSCLKRLELQGFIRSYWGAKSNGGRRKYFTLTDMGRELFAKNQSEWEYSRTLIDRLISDKEVDLHTYTSTDESEEVAELDEIEFLSESAQEEDGENFENAEATKFVSNPLYVENDTTATSEKFEQVPVKKSFRDTTAIMNQLYEIQTQDGASYLDKLVSDKYVVDRTATASASSQNYFQDFYSAEEDEFATDIDKETEQNARIETLLAFPDNEKQISEQPFYKTENVEHNKTVEPSVTNPIDNVAYKQETNAPASLLDQFRKYDEKVDLPQKVNLIEREYKNILSKFTDSAFQSNSTQLKSSHLQTNAVEEVTKDLAEKSVDIDELYEAKTVTETLANQESAASTSLVKAFTSDVEINKKLTKLKGEMREMGDSVKIREHNRGSAREYNAAYYYNSNKLMLVHYAILFAVMLIETLISAMVVFLGFGLQPPYGIWFYVAAVGISLLFPVVAFIKNCIAPNKRKRINFSLRNSIIYRLTIMVQCWLIIYCMNILFRMPVTFSLEYLSTLLLPALLCTNFPISALIFNFLYRSKKYAAEE